MPVALRVKPWPDPVLDVLGHDPRSWYAETFWLPTLGPTALLLMRHLADRFERTPEGVELPSRRHRGRARARRPRGQQLAAHAQPRPAPPVRARVHRRRNDHLGAHVTPAGASPPRPPAARRTPGASTTNGWPASAPHRIELARRRKARRVALMLVAQGEPMDTVERALHIERIPSRARARSRPLGARPPARARRRRDRRAPRPRRLTPPPRPSQTSLPATVPPPVAAMPGWGRVARTPPRCSLVVGFAPRPAPFGATGTRRRRHHAYSETDRCVRDRRDRNGCVQLIVEIHVPPRTRRACRPPSGRRAPARAEQLRRRSAAATSATRSRATPRRSRTRASPARTPQDLKSEYDGLDAKLEQMKSDVPDAIKGDFETYITFVKKIQTALAKAELRLHQAVAVGPHSVSPIRSSASAWAHIGQYLSQHCGIAPPTT